ncbi:Integrase core domain [Popillia japonica]|uniref:Integrase core domain n=1 Tax=Popillia japonica TaxID=7064 RepID=A0AAW1M6V7_POPJA
METNIYWLWLINFPFQLISADLLGPYPRSKNGNQYLLVVVDWFTKFCVVHPMAKATSRAIIKFLENQVFLIYGVPQIFVCDNGPQFRSTEFQNILREYKVQKIWYNARYHLQINATERQNRVLVTAIPSYITDNHKTWDVSIHKVAQAIRLAKHDVTGHSPA